MIQYFKISGNSVSNYGLKIGKIPHQNSRLCEFSLIFQSILPPYHFELGFKCYPYENSREKR